MFNILILLLGVVLVCADLIMIAAIGYKRNIEMLKGKLVLLSVAPAMDRGGYEAAAAAVDMTVDEFKVAYSMAQIHAHTPVPSLKTALYRYLLGLYLILGIAGVVLLLFITRVA